MDQSLRCWVCKAQDFCGIENFCFRLNENQYCVGCLLTCWNTINSNRVVISASCAQHNRAFDLFCMKCQILLCGKCMMSHREHEIEDIDQMHDYINYLKTQISIKTEKFLQNLEKTKIFLKEFKNFLEVFKKSGDKNEYSLGKSYFCNNKERYEHQLNKNISLEIQKREEKIFEFKKVVWRSRRIGEKCISDLRSLEPAKTSVIFLRELFSSASLIQKISIFLYIKSKKV